MTKLDVLTDFKNNINPFCEQEAKKLPEWRRREVCSIVTPMFLDAHCQSHITQAINDEFKMDYRQRNGRLKGFRQKLSIIESGFLDTTVETLEYRKRGKQNA